MYDLIRVLFVSFDDLSEDAVHDMHGSRAARAEETNVWVAYWQWGQRWAPSTGPVRLPVPVLKSW